MTVPAAIDYSKIAPADALKMNADELRGYLNWMEAENKRLQTEKADVERKSAEQSTFGIKIGRKGTTSVTGFGRYGISLYDSQWDSLIPLIPAIQRFRKAYAALIQARVDNPIGDDSPNDFKSLKLKADSEFKTPVA